MQLSARAPVARPAAARASRARSVRVAAAANRPVWLPNVTPPKYLDGTLAGDNGFDPLNLGADPQRLKWYAEAEKTNGRWAMMAVAGILGTEILGLPKWYEAGAASDVPTAPLAATTMLFTGAAETFRYKGWKETGTSGFLFSFPFDPAGMNSKEMAVKEVKNGRLAMVAFVGFAVQAIATRTTPLEGLSAHIGSGGAKNITYYLTHIPETLAQ
ncbi:light-harvesting protein of photosystem I [Raphidocelis subcapitata]|uniref:Chlorophyll a-b binding protein, chloroplastic n=1 Tax=Raphidocelis subcapitata TaxID=307507 RepID=A0A2V0PLE4_9CHLO|nr:light-harvesting protein of photosystem I [Raphidocelis subcapitata]|eukprot:GBF98157.1 light-harvesting protein of photosystem I [Raphidocelis subcapitata]